ncbi:LLM class flavin-dependent oxidoreductase [Pseudonocardia oroxyli]|uniref:Flavin-dependent oxidoreductase, luciferase family (Includes alkanesulfonate monooxygenase SsuD and methylene tetrahydromethanopterin reductase) n=1 Tax=Pseudonocardia oroxyli TaxID=366584 RepID=A0A1G8C6W9_PSEOR|nr:LLM class flavin-dependent oxidoreductase [Pseudonocardia oroxyli]SDH41134.1 Flavin-dependent oxidoreductase, luciferase family (includes alkanesulfonate monooxygenase SsuD and methylene tetrahydromethanopterin reductase) [Pseudonocardia oroxyli]
MHLNLNLRARGFHRAAWQHPSARPHAVTDVDFLTDLVRTCEDAAFDAVFLADTPVHRDPPLAQPLEPFALLSAAAAATTHIGLIGTLSATYTDAQLAAHRLASLDRLSGGRLGVNVVTNAGDEVARNFGADAHPAHADRYARAADFLDTLLRAWAPGVSPQGHPVIVQAGASDRGRDLAGRYAEAVYTGSSTVEDGAAFRADVLARAARSGRPAGGVKILPGLIPYVGRTEREARDTETELERLAVRAVDPIPRLGELLGLDLAPYDPDGPVPLDALPSVAEFRGAVSRFTRLRTIAERERPTIRELAERAERSLNNVHWTIAGTGRQIADQLEHWYRGGAADGFNVLVPLHPTGLRDFTEQVVPELRRRGLFRDRYATTTLRGHFGLAVPHPVAA